MIIVSIRFSVVAMPTKVMTVSEAKEYFARQIVCIRSGHAQWLAPYARQSVIARLEAWEKLGISPKEWRYDSQSPQRQYLWGIGSKGNTAYMFTFVLSPTEEWGIVDFSFVQQEKRKAIAVFPVYAQR